MWYTGYMRLEMPQTKNKSVDKQRELNFTFSCFYFMNIEGLEPN